MKKHDKNLKEALEKLKAKEQFLKEKFGTPEKQE